MFHKIISLEISIVHKIISLEMSVVHKIISLKMSFEMNRRQDLTSLLLLLSQISRPGPVTVCEKVDGQDMGS